LHCNHGYNRDNLYWGAKRYQTPWVRRAVQWLRKEAPAHYAGDEKESDYFWGDLCRKYVRHVRNFTFSRLNMFDVNPEMPYRLSGTEYVNMWFSTADAPDVTAFVRLFSDEAIERLEHAGGLCIVSTHLGKGFVRDGVLDPRFETIIQRLSRKPGWFVPVTPMLDYLVRSRGKGQELSRWKALCLEAKFLLDKALA